MSKSLVLDLAWTTTGWVVWDFDEDVPLWWGDFTARNKTGKPAGDTAEYIAHIVEQIWANVVRVANDCEVDRIIYEYTDWHRNLWGGRRSAPQRRKEYKIERITQRTLGRAETIMALIGIQLGFEIIGYGANQVKNGLDVKSKQHAAMIVAAAYPRLFEYIDEKNKHLKCIVTGEKLSHHISDAMTVAMFALNQHRLKEAMGV